MFAQVLQDFIQIFQYIPFSILCSLPIIGGLYFYHKIRKTGQWPMKKWWIIFLFFFYGFMLLQITFFCREPGSRSGIDWSLFPASFTDLVLWTYAIENVIMLVPLGIILPYVLDSSKYFAKGQGVGKGKICVFTAMIFSILIELAQLVTGRGYCQIEDVFMNTIGAFLGYIIYYIFINRHVPKKLRPVFTILVILWMAVIFSFSMENGSRSENTSSGVAQLIARIFVSDFDVKTPEEQKVVLTRLSYPIRKCGHMTEYAILGFLVYAMFYAYGFKGRRRFLLAVILAVLYAASDEIHQVFVPGRTGRFTDVLIDSIGILMGNGVAKICLRK